MKIVSYGGGTNSTAMLIECVNRGIEVNLILFADTGGERPHTYQYVRMFSDWLVEKGFPAIQTVKNGGVHKNLEQECLTRKALPSLAYGFKTCSQKWKIRPQDQFLNRQPWAISQWEQGKKITKLIGFDADEPQRAKDYEDKKYTVKYPLIEWEMGREECTKTIEDAGLCLPGKSACFYCPSTKPTEVRQLKAIYPDLAQRAIDMENNADLSQLKGLGRNFAWSELLKNSEMFDDYSNTPELACGCYDG